MSQRSTYLQHIEFLNKVGNLLATQQQMEQQEVARLITETAPHIARIENDNIDNALKFNVFSALGITRKEVIQSRFLAYLLDPNEHHCQSSIFLKTFLAKIGLPEMSKEQNKRVRVATEHPAEGLGRMDIVLFCQPDWLVVIENKVDAGEAEQQLPRYAKWLDKQQGYNPNSKRLVFLTPTGHESVTGIAGEYQQLSYLDLAEAFELLLNKIKAQSVRIVLTQYIKNCKLIGGMDVATQDKQLLELLTKPENIKIALEIEQQTQLIRTQVVKEFGKHIQKILQRKLELARLESTWKAESVFFNENQLDLQIKTSKHQGKPNYFMKALCVFYKSRTGNSGWVRPQLVDFRIQSPAMLDTKDLTNKMINNGCNGAEPWLVGSKNLRGGKNGFVLTDIDDIFACIEDNRSEDHPLANTIAEELWLMFTTYREDIEALDSFKQAAAS